MVNCAHPTHFAAVLDADAAWTSRIRGVRANASTMSHAELDEATELDAGDPVELAAQYRELRGLAPLAPRARRLLRHQPPAHRRHQRCLRAGLSDRYPDGGTGHGQTSAADRQPDLRADRCERRRGADGRDARGPRLRDRGSDRRRRHQSRDHRRLRRPHRGDAERVGRPGGRSTTRVTADAPPSTAGRTSNDGASARTSATWSPSTWPPAARATSAACCPRS